MVIKYWQNNGKFEELVSCEPHPLSAEITTNKDEDICDAMYAMHNADNRPDGKIRRSMSVGDIVSIDGRAYCCFSVGWTRL